VTAPVVLITGALTGIGRATSLAFAREGARIVVSGRRDEEGKELAEELRGLGAEAEFRRTDVRHEEDVRGLVDWTVGRFGRLDVAVNNAGTEGNPGPVTEQTATPAKGGSQAGRQARRLGSERPREAPSPGVIPSQSEARAMSIEKPWVEGRELLPPGESANPESAPHFRATTRQTNRSLGLAFALPLAVALFGIGADAEGPRTVSGLKNPESAAVGPDGKVYVTVIGEREKEGDGSVAIVEPSGKITTFAACLDDPHGLVIVDGSLFVADVKKVWKVDPKGRVEVFAGPDAFPRPPGYLNDIAHDGAGHFYVSDSGDRAGKKGAVFRIDAGSRKATLVLDAETTSPPIPFPNGVLLDGPARLLIADFSLGHLYRFGLDDGKLERIGGGFGGTDGLARDSKGRLFVGDWKNGRLFQYLSEAEPPRLLSDKFGSAADIAIMPDGKTLLVPDMKGGTLTWFPVP
jgi:gluconolactonase